MRFDLPQRPLCSYVTRRRSRVLESGQVPGRNAIGRTLSIRGSIAAFRSRIALDESGYRPGVRRSIAEAFIEGGRKM